jgi:EAL domain-containing protein (putative c-di-GMP-specific phosphodiesterase class I)
VFSFISLCLVGVKTQLRSYASLRHIQALRPQSVRLDLEWVHAIEADPAIRALVAGLVQFGRQMDCQIIGEGVETEDQHAALSELGVDFGQGFRFGVPAPAGSWKADQGPDETLVTDSCLTAMALQGRTG